MADQSITTSISTTTTTTTTAAILTALHAQGYAPLATLPLADAMPFLRQQLMRPTAITLPYFLLVFGCMVGLGVLGGWAAAGHGGASALASLFAGIGATLLLIYLHEAIHAAVYRALGARHVYIKANWRKLYFLCTADGFVVGYAAFVRLAYMPALVITSGCLAAMVLSWALGATYAITFFAGMAGMHLALCGGDVALMSFLYTHRHRQPLTWDEEATGISYFYALP